MLSLGEEIAVCPASYWLLDSELGPLVGDGTTSDNSMPRTQRSSCYIPCTPSSLVCCSQTSLQHLTSQVRAVQLTTSTRPAPSSISNLYTLSSVYPHAHHPAPSSHSVDPESTKGITSEDKAAVTKGETYKNQIRQMFVGRSRSIFNNEPANVQ